MSIFSSKRDAPKPIRAIYYEGDLPNFGVNVPTQISIEQSMVKITKKNPDITVNLEADRIQGIDVYWKEEAYMLKYHGNAASTSKAKGINKSYFVIRYLTDEKLLSFSFWCTALEMGAINKWVDSIAKGTLPVEVSL